MSPMEKGQWNAQKRREKLQKQKKVDIKFKAIKGADHFYENYSEEFTLVVDKYIKDNLRSN